VAVLANTLPVSGSTVVPASATVNTTVAFFSAVNADATAAASFYRFPALGNLGVAKDGSCGRESRGSAATAKR
jgi:hypothetical protein